MRLRRPPSILPSEITPPEVYFNRRQLIAAGLATGLALTLPDTHAAATGKALKYTRNDKLSIKDDPSQYENITTYNNYYEFGVDKDQPAKNAGSLRTDPWTVKVSGEAQITGRYNLEDLIKPHALEERIYRLRCVEAWSMVIPWVGFPLGDLIKRFKPTSKAKYVAFKTLYAPDQMPGQRRSVLQWPYVEGLRMDEAMHPLTVLAVGLYGKTLPNQNGAPLRLVVPWKYGFKGIKSIVEIRFTERQPPTSWNISAPQEYGFYANVNPQVDHPRWSQASERIIGAGLFNNRRATDMFNGYAGQVASLYSGMNLSRYY